MYFLSHCYISPLDSSKNNNLYAQLQMRQYQISSLNQNSHASVRQREFATDQNEYGSSSGELE